jgi:hypothetical protein
MMAEGRYGSSEAKNWGHEIKMPLKQAKLVAAASTTSEQHTELLSPLFKQSISDAQLISSSHSTEWNDTTNVS